MLIEVGDSYLAVTFRSCGLLCCMTDGTARARGRAKQELRDETYWQKMLTVAEIKTNACIV